MKIEWIAGFFEGEGCITLQHDRRKHRIQPRICLVQKDKKILQKIKEELEKVGISGEIYIQRDNRNKNFWWTFVIQDFISIINFIKTILPYCQFRGKKFEKKLKIIENLYQKSDLAKPEELEFIKNNINLSDRKMGQQLHRSKSFACKYKKSLKSSL